jgi:hypothetical protein
VSDVQPPPLPRDANVPVPAAADQYAIDVPAFGPKDITSSRAVSAGGPVFTTDGRAVGLSSPPEPGDVRSLMDGNVVAVDIVCEVLATAHALFDTTALPDATPLPVEPTGRLPQARADAAAPGPAFTLAPYQLSSSDFDVTFLTPAVIAAAAGKRDWTGGRADDLARLRAATEFEHWSDYVADAPPALYVRVTPRLVESFWMKVARGAASTQGVEIPPIQRLRPGFSQLQLICGDRVVTPIHPFRIQTRVTETEAIEEGFYVFAPDAIGPDCGTVSIVLSSVRDPDKTETRTVGPAIVRRVWEDFASLRVEPDR